MSSHTIEERIAAWRKQPGGGEAERFVDLLSDAEEELRRLRQALGVIASEGYVSTNSRTDYLKALCDLQVNRATAALEGRPLPSDEQLDVLPEVLHE